MQARVGRATRTLQGRDLAQFLGNQPEARARTKVDTLSGKMLTPTTATELKRNEECVEIRTIQKMKELLTVRVKDEGFQHTSGTVQDELFMNELGTWHT